MLVRYRGINNKGVLERPWKKWRVLEAISPTLKCQFTGKCWKVDFPTPCTTAPLSTRRDIAMLGLIHRTIRGKGPSQFKDFFWRDPQHHAKFVDPRVTSRSPLIKRSAMGLVAIYNLLPHNVVCARSVSAFQKGLQELIVSFAVTVHPQWPEVLSPRLPLALHPLTSL